MKKKIVGILVMTLLILTVLPVVGTINNYGAKNDIHLNPEIQTNCQPVNNPCEAGKHAVITITRPVVDNLYLFDTVVIPLGGPALPLLIIGPITLQAQTQPNVVRVDWQISDSSGPCNPDWPAPALPPNWAQLYGWWHVPFLGPGLSITITAFAYDATNTLLGSQTINAIKIF